MLRGIWLLSKVGVNSLFSFIDHEPIVERSRSYLSHGGGRVLIGGTEYQGRNERTVVQESIGVDQDQAR